MLRVDLNLIGGNLLTSLLMAQTFARLFSQSLARLPRRTALSLPLVSSAKEGHCVRAKAYPRSFFREYAAGRHTRNTNQFKVWPFVAIVLAGTGTYMLVVKSRVAQETMPPTDSTKQLAAPVKKQPTFSPDDVTVIFVLGGPGAGKGTQCANLVRDYHFTHLSAGDLLREEQNRPGSEFGEGIKEHIKNGTIVPMEVTVQLLENAMTAVVQKSTSSDPQANPKANSKGKFLIDGFPRKMDQALRFEAAVCPARFVLFFDCPEEELQKRLLKRGETSGRADDNAESIAKRFKTFVETSMPVVEYYEEQGRVVKIRATGSPDEVFGLTKRGLEERGVGTGGDF